MKGALEDRCGGVEWSGRGADASSCKFSGLVGALAYI